MNVVLLGGHSSSTWAVANALQNDCGLDAIIIEDPGSRISLLRRRAMKLGWWCAGSQLVFSFYSRFLDRMSRERQEEIASANGLNMSMPTASSITRVCSVNSDAALSLLQRLAPRVIVVNGTRIISRRILEGVNACFINTHAGITPKYRGVHGGYWALANQDAANAGVTIHLVDPGIDTGGILYQATISPTEADNFSTYPVLQLAAGIPLLKRAIRDALDGKLRVVKNDLPSRLHYHPTIWTYIANRFHFGTK